MAGSRVDGVHHGVTRSALDAVRRWAESEAEGRRREGDLVPLRVRSVQVGSGQQVARGQVDVGQRVAGIGAAVNRADDGLDRRARLAQGKGGVSDRTTGGDDVLDEGHAASVDICTLGQPLGSVLLGLLPDEECGRGGEAAEHRGERDAAELQAAKKVCVFGNQRDHALGDSPKEVRVGFEEVLVEVLGGDLTTTKREGARQSAGPVNVTGKFAEEVGHEGSFP